MDTRERLRNLVTNIFMPDFDYLNTNYSFDTVFHRTGLSYCKCMCGFRHEYLDYIGDDGNLNEEIYDEVVQCVVDTRCPHVQDVPQEYVNVASVSSIHIALAVNTTKVLDMLTEYCQHNSVQLLVSKTQLYGIYPFEMAILKNCAVALSYRLFMNLSDLRKCKYSLTYAREVKEENQNVGPVLEIQERLDVEFYIKSNSSIIKVLKTSMFFYHKSYSLTYAIELIFEKKPAFVKHLISQNTSGFGKHSIAEVASLCCELSIVYDEPDVLDHLLHCQSKSGFAASKMSKICHTLERDACKEILLKHGYYQEKAATISLIERGKLMASLLEEFNDGTRDVILSRLKQITVLSDVHLIFGGDQFPMLQRFWKKVTSPVVLRALLDCRFDIDCINEKGDTLLVDLLRDADYKVRYPGFRQTIELYIFENPNQEKNLDAISLGIKVDQYLNSHLPNYRFGGKFVMDAKLHGLYGHGGTSELNFYSALLIESGFPLPSDFHNNPDILTENQHPTVCAYLKRVMEMPFTLKHLSRNVLRKHYVGRQIHNFVEKTHLPRSIKNYILLKLLLKCVPDKFLQ